MKAAGRKKLSDFFSLVYEFVEESCLKSLIDSAVVAALAVTHRTMDREVPGSNPAGSWAFSLSLLSLVSLKSLSSHSNLSISAVS